MHGVSDFCCRPMHGQLTESCHIYGPNHGTKLTTDRSLTHGPTDFLFARTVHLTEMPFIRTSHGTYLPTDHSWTYGPTDSLFAQAVHLTELCHLYEPITEHNYGPFTDLRTFFIGP